MLNYLFLFWYGCLENTQVNPKQINIENTNFLEIKESIRLGVNSKTKKIK